MRRKATEVWDRSRRRDTSEFSLISFHLQCQEEAELRIREYEETIRQAAEQEQQKIHTMKDKYEKQLQSEKEAFIKLKGNSGTMTQKVTKDFRAIFKFCSLLLVSVSRKDYNVFLMAVTQVHNLQKQIDDHFSDITSLKKERHTLMGFIRTLETDICVLKKQVSKYKKICQEKVTEEQRPAVLFVSH